VNGLDEAELREQCAAAALVLARGAYGRSSSTAPAAAAEEVRWAALEEEYARAAKKLPATTFPEYLASQAVLGAPIAMLSHHATVSTEHATRSGSHATIMHIMSAHADPLRRRPGVEERECCAVHGQVDKSWNLSRVRTTLMDQLCPGELEISC
jgi:hypothetical protein